MCRFFVSSPGKGQRPELARYRHRPTRHRRSDFSNALDSISIYVEIAGMRSTRRPSPQAVRLLTALAAKAQAWRYGYDLSKETGLGAGTLYPLLDRLAKQGLLESEWRPSEKEGRPPRHAYRLTRAGAAFALKWPEAPKNADTPRGKLRPARS